MSLLATSVDRYAAWILRSYEWRRYAAMQRLVHDVVDVCSACHTRLPSPSDSPVAKDFLAGTETGLLPALERARLQIATRRFGDALATLEEQLGQAFAAHRGGIPEEVREHLEMLRAVAESTR